MWMTRLGMKGEGILRRGGKNFVFTCLSPAQIKDNRFARRWKCQDVSDPAQTLGRHDAGTGTCISVSKELLSRERKILQPVGT